METSEGNPAYRLNRVLSEAARQDTGKTTKVAWATVFGVRPDDTMAIFHCLILLSNLVAEVESRIGEMEHINHGFYLQNFPKIKQALSHTNLDAGWGEPRRFLDEATLRDVAFCGERLKEQFGDAEVSQDDLKDLLSSLENLIEEVKGSRIDAELKSALSRLLAVLDRAIREYRFTGASGLRAALSRALGELFLSWLKSEEKDRNDGVWAKVRLYLVRIDSVLARVLRYKPVIDSRGPGANARLQ